MAPIVVKDVALNPFEEGSDIKRKVLLRVGWVGQDAVGCNYVTSKLGRYIAKAQIA
jgi:hypothetical protein